jgi:DNA helicase-2/ATP-dependent DNA helicase PcrA
VLKTKAEIIAHFSSPVLVKAGPGSGKTTLLADKIQFLLDNKTDKNTITVLTYNTDTKRNLHDKLVDTKGSYKIDPKDLPDITTIHALGYEIVNKYPEYVGLSKTNLDVQDDDRIARLIYRDSALLLTFSESDGKEARKCKQEGDCNIDLQSKKCAICKKYREIMSIFNLIDFDDQVLFACDILEGNEDILAEYQSRAKYLLVDEYQDINAAQFRLIKLLSEKSRNGFFAVGDDAQSIYSFRGCDPKFILRFETDFPGAEIPPWSYSHRCHEKTMTDACNVLEKYYQGWKRPTLDCDIKEGEEPDLYQWRSEIEEAKGAAHRAKQFSHDKKSVLILAPKKEMFILIGKELSRQKVPFTGQENLLPPYVNDQIDSINILMNWIAHPLNSFFTRLVIEELLNRGIAKVPGGKKGKRDRPETRERRIAEETEVAKLWSHVSKRRSLFTVLNTIGKPSSTLEKIKKIMQSIKTSYEDLGEDKKEEFVKQLFVHSGIWANPSTLVRDLSSVIEVLRSKRPVGIGLVQLMTMRRAKGLEADVVIIVGLEDDIFPSPGRNIDEEARLFYVSITRAKERAYLFHSWRRPGNISYGKGLTNKRRSRFLDDIGRPSVYK